MAASQLFLAVHQAVANVHEPIRVGRSAGVMGYHDYGAAAGFWKGFSGN